MSQDELRASIRAFHKEREDHLDEGLVSEATRLQEKIEAGLTLYYRHDWETGKWDKTRKIQSIHINERHTVQHRTIFMVNSQGALPVTNTGRGSAWATLLRAAGLERHPYLIEEEELAEAVRLKMKANRVQKQEGR